MMMMMMMMMMKSELHHQISAPSTTVCFTILDPELFSAVARSATPL